jgi:nitrite reductase/ring-hydroxylating ferredoxin subunit
MAADENRSESTAREEDALLGRRHVLTVIAVAAPTLAAACALQSGDLPADNQDPENVGGDAGAVDTGAVDTGSGVPDTGGGCSTGVNVGPVANFVVGQWKKVGSGSNTFNIGRDASGIWAYSNTCTHNNSCQIGAPGTTTGAIRCPCHGAKFDGNGGVTLGPASRPLNNYEVIVCAGNVYVNKAKVVPKGTRTPA